MQKVSVPPYLIALFKILCKSVLGKQVTRGTEALDALLNLLPDETNIALWMSKVAEVTCHQSPIYLSNLADSKKDIGLHFP